MTSSGTEALTAATAPRLLLGRKPTVHPTAAVAAPTAPRGGFARHTIEGGNDLQVIVARPVVAEMVPPETARLHCQSSLLNISTDGASGPIGIDDGLNFTTLSWSKLGIEVGVNHDDDALCAFSNRLAPYRDWEGVRLSRCSGTKAAGALASRRYLGPVSRGGGGMGAGAASAAASRSSLSA